MARIKRMWKMKCDVCGHVQWRSWLLSWIADGCPMRGCDGTMRRTGNSMVMELDEDD